MTNPVTLDADEPVSAAFEQRARNKVSGFPILSKGKLVGMLTSRDLRTVSDMNVKISTVMTKDPVTASRGRFWCFEGPHYDDGHLEARKQPERKP